MWRTRRMPPTGKRAQENVHRQGRDCNRERLSQDKHRSARQHALAITTVRALLETTCVAEWRLFPKRPAWTLARAVSEIPGRETHAIFPKRPASAQSRALLETRAAPKGLCFPKQPATLDVARAVRQRSCVHPVLTWVHPFTVAKRFER